MWRGGFPLLDDRIHDGPGIVDPIGAWKQRLIAVHGIEQQPFVSIGRFFDVEGRVIAEIHRHRPHTNIWSWLLSEEGVENTKADDLERFGEQPSAVQGVQRGDQRVTGQIPEAPKITSTHGSGGVPFAMAVHVTSRLMRLPPGVA